MIVGLGARAVAINQLALFQLTILGSRGRNDYHSASWWLDLLALELHVQERLPWQQECLTC